MNYHYEPLEDIIDPTNSEFGNKANDFLREDINQYSELIEKDWGEEQNIKAKEYEEWYLKKSFEIIEIFEKEFILLEEKKEYFFGCSFAIYHKYYDKRKEYFLNEYEDATEIEFIEAELRKGIFNLPYEYLHQFLAPYKLQIDFGLKKRFQFLTEIAKGLGYEIIYIPKQEDLDGTPIKETFNLKATPKINTQNNITPLQWNGGQTELIELIKALILAGKVKGIQKEIIANFAEFFQIEIKNPDKLLQDIKLRSNGSETLFLDQLKKTLLDYIIK